MFDNIAPKYDFLNHFLSLGIDKLWRKLKERYQESYWTADENSWHDFLFSSFGIGRCRTKDFIEPTGKYSADEDGRLGRRLWRLHDKGYLVIQDPCGWYEGHMPGSEGMAVLHVPIETAERILILGL